VVEYNNEMLVLGAIRVAERIINALDNHRLDEFDIEHEVKCLRELARMGDELRSGTNGRRPQGAESDLTHPVPVGRKAGRKSNAVSRSRAHNPRSQNNP